MERFYATRTALFYLFTSTLLSLSTLNTARSQITFLSSDVMMTVDAFADDSGGSMSDSDHDMASSSDVTTFMESISASAGTAISSAVSDSRGEFDVTSSSVEAFGETTAEAFGSELGAAGSFGNFDLEISFQVMMSTDFTADLVLTAEDVAGTGADASVRLFDSGGTDVFSHLVTGADIFEDLITGTLAPDTYTLRAFANASASADASSSGGSSRAQVDIDIDFGSPAPPPMFMFSCDPFPFCPNEIIPKISSVHGFVPGLADEPIPFWNEGLGLDIFLDTLFDLGNGPVISDIAIIGSAFDGPEDMYPENLYEQGTLIRIVLAFDPGSLTPNHLLEELPRSKLVGGLAELVDPSGKVLATTRMYLIPEPNTCMLMLGLALSMLTLGPSARR